MDCYFRQSWRDSRLSFLGPIKSLSLSIKMLERIWRPDTYFYNGKHSYVHTITVPNKLLRISQDGDILYSMRFVRAWIYALYGKLILISQYLRNIFRLLLHTSSLTFAVKYMIEIYMIDKFNFYLVTYSIAKYYMKI